MDDFHWIFTVAQPNKVLLKFKEKNVILKFEEKNVILESNLHLSFQNFASK